MTFAKYTCLIVLSILLFHAPSAFSITFKTFKMVVEAGADDRASGKTFDETLQSPLKFSRSPEVKVNDKMEFSVTVDSQQLAHQMSVLFQHQDQPRVQKSLMMNFKSNGMYRLKLDFKSSTILDSAKVATPPSTATAQTSHFFAHPGEYKVTVLAGMVGSEEPKKWQLGEIHHKFKEAEKMPSVLVSLLFSAFTVCPWVALLIVWKKHMGVKLVSQLLSMSTNTSLFLVVLFLSLGTLGLYWTVWNIFQFVISLVPSSILLALTIRNCLGDFKY